MSHCREEHATHGHGSAEGSLFSRIDRENVRCLNESVLESGKNVIKPWHEREDTTKYVESDVDEQLIFFIPFTGSVKLKSISIKAGPGDSCPSKLKVYINRDDMDFDAAETYESTQEWDLVQTNEIVEISKMSNVQNLNLYFSENFGEEITRIYYIGLKGEWTEIKKDPVITLYEAAANPTDHKKIHGEERLHHAF
ncbi:10662_t:CDS:2 [Ambispora gerdemannii]|uniref:10662_t:CDS:1 n=1 Tax=Ambispora gerdemannii TaxID=144530 RepID=A0A9N8UZN4_9GLOM|nr:10662_t:CDS:2 [Ambispora gerdemannii]